MGLKRRTIIDQIEIKRDGTVQVRLAKQVVDGDEVLRSEYHRLGVEPGADLESYLPAVNAHLSALHEAEVEEAEWDRVRRIVSLEHRAEAVAAYRKEVARAQREIAGA
jgi:hypothetical protein